MVTRQSQLKQQVESLREENQRLDKLGSAAESGREPGGEGENAVSRKESEPDSAEPWRSAEGDFPAQRSDSTASARGTDGSRGAGGSAPTRGRHSRMSNTVPDGETDFRKSSGSVDGAA